jgi:hypothetical protein
MTHKTFKLDETNDKPSREPDRSGPLLPPIDVDPATDEDVERLQRFEADTQAAYRRAYEQMLEFGAGKTDEEDDGEPPAS